MSDQRISRIVESVRHDCFLGYQKPREKKSSVNLCVKPDGRGGI